MTPAGELAVIALEQDALEALATIGPLDLSQLLIVHGDELVGLLRREDILKCPRSVPLPDAHSFRITAMQPVDHKPDQPMTQTSTTV